MSGEVRPEVASAGDDLCAQALEIVRDLASGKLASSLGGVRR